MDAAIEQAEKKQIEAAPCPVCEQTTYRWRFNKGGRDIWRCTGCSLERQWPVPGPGDLARIYESEYSSGVGQGYLNQTAMNELRARSRLNALEGLAKPGRWLDVGCGGGDFVAAGRARNIDIQGIDLSQNAVAGGIARGLPLRCIAIEDFPTEQQFDTVTAFDLIEHLADPAECLRQMRKRIAPGGVLILTTPDLQSYSRQLLGRRWFFYLPDLHLVYFDRPGMQRLLHRCGFSVVAMKRSIKPVAIDYALEDMRTFNPDLYKLLKPLCGVLPKRVRTHLWPLYLGEMIVVARTV
jgi:SAM-dependent methyltransferase